MIDYLHRIMEHLPLSTSPYVRAIAFLVLIIVVARGVDLLIDRVFRKFVRLTKSEVDDLVVDAVHSPVYVTIILFGCTLVVSYLHASPEVLYYANNALYTAIAVIWTIVLIKLGNIVIENVLYKASDITGLRKDIVPLFENVLKIGLIGGMLAVVLSIWKINVTPLLASAGIAGVAIAIAAKDTLSNFFGGISIFMDRPYKIGDYVVLDGGERGEVVAIGVRSTRMKTRDDVMITIPNAIIANSKIINESAPIPNFRVRISIGVAYGSDIDVVEQTLLDIAGANANILSDPGPRVRFREFGDSALHFELLCWAREPALRGLVVHQINREIYKKFGEMGITIPFPQRDLHIYPT